MIVDPILLICIRLCSILIVWSFVDFFQVICVQPALTILDVFNFVNPSVVALNIEVYLLQQ